MSAANFSIQAIRAFNDNYIWLLRNQQHIVLVDPGDAQVCIDYIEQHNLILTDILITHHHADHIGGLTKLIDYNKQLSQPLNVYAPAINNIVGANNVLSGGETVYLVSLDIKLEVVAVPGHTLGHIAYYNDTSLFCGDTLFSGGCGRLFEGTPAQMLSALKTFAALDGNTKVYCSHEYTLSNLQFALTVEPENMALVQYYNEVVKLREQDKMTLPSTINKEKEINPFLRCHLPALKVAASEYLNADVNKEVDTFAAIRRWKDNA